MVQVKEHPVKPQAADSPAAAILAQAPKIVVRERMCACIEGWVRSGRLWVLFLMRMWGWDRRGFVLLVAGEDEGGMGFFFFLERRWEKKGRQKMISNLVF